MSKSISIIIPVYNEEGNIELAVNRILSVIGNDLNDYCCEIIIVNDGSRDDSLGKICDVVKKSDKVKAINLSRNFGQTQAYKAGIDYALGEYIVFYSADMESSPSSIISVVQKLNEGYDFVNTKRGGRSVGGKNIQSKIANKIINRISKINISDRGSGIKGIRSCIAKNMVIYGEMHRFLPDYASIYTEKIVEIETDYSERSYGVSSYKNRIRSFSVLLDIFALFFILGMFKKPYILQPGRTFGVIGIGSFFMGLFLFIYFVIIKMFFSASLSDRPLFLISIMLILLGVMLITFIAISEVLLRVYYSKSGVKQYIVKNFYE